ncbi:hypothetical protein [Burkholderia ubonensis]|uniref:hypothetical protein n=1 Tax=Burkholderia ubonensis TaxID=101571 RepID=UPI00016A3722|nr:hypothetical protein [Burkholderia ubonensis]
MLTGLFQPIGQPISRNVLGLVDHAGASPIFWHFCDAIAEALCPLVEKDLVGIERVIGKQVTRQVLLAPSTNQRDRWPLHMGLQRVLLSDDDFTVDEMLRESPETSDASTELELNVGPRREVVELPSIVDLVDDDRRAPETLLPAVPVPHEFAGFALRHGAIAVLVAAGAMPMWSNAQIVGGLN